MRLLFYVTLAADVVMVLKCRRTSEECCTGHVERKKCMQILVGKSERTRRMEARRWEVNIDAHVK